MKEVSVLHFSPTGGTKKIADHLAQAVAAVQNEFDLTVPVLKSHTMAADVPVVVAVPVFAGRVPARAITALKECRGNGAPTVAVVVCGNRAYEDALLELRDCLTEQGFNVIAAGAFIARHSMLGAIAHDRPDEADFKALQDFGVRVAEKIAQGVEQGAKLDVPGNYPYKEAARIPAVPFVTDACVLCGHCARVCPMQAIDLAAPNTTGESCIMCMRCVSECHMKARILPPPLRAKLEQMLAPYKEKYGENEVYPE